MKFLGKNYTFENQPAETGHVGDTLQRMISAELPAAAANQRELEAARAVEKKRQRAEDRAVAAMLGQDQDFDL